MRQTGYPAHCPKKTLSEAVECVRTKGLRAHSFVKVNQKILLEGNVHYGGMPLAVSKLGHVGLIDGIPDSIQ